MSKRLIAVPVAVALVVLLGFVASTPSSPASTARDRGNAGSIYFFSNPSSGVALIGQHLVTPNHLVIRPDFLPLFEDGQWVLEKLSWKGWGSPVAKAEGVSNSDDDVPNVAEGKRIYTWAKVTLSQQGVWRHQRIYRCIRIKVPPPASSSYSCLQRLHRYIGLMSPGSGTPVGVVGEGSR